MADEILKRDQNHITVLAGITDDVGQDVTMLRVDSITKRLLISADTSGSGFPFIRTDGTSTTTASIPFAQGLSVSDTKIAYIGGISNSTARGKIYNDTNSFYITGLLRTNSYGAHVVISGGDSVQTGAGGNGGMTYLKGGDYDHAGDLIQYGFTATGTTITSFSGGSNIGGFISSGNNIADFAVGNDFYVTNNAIFAKGIGTDGKGSTSGYTLIGTGEAATKIGLDRIAVAGSNGVTLTIHGGWAKNAATNANGGNLILAPGTGTGSGTGSTLIQAVGGGGSGTADSSPATVSAWAKTNVTLADPYDFVIGTTTGTKFGTATGQKIGFFNVTPVVQQANSVSLEAVLSNFGFRASGSAAPITVGTFSSTSTTDSTTHSTGGGKFSGGVGITKSLFVGGNIGVDTVGFGLQIKTGSNAKMGTGTLSSGTVTINTTAVKSTSFIFLSDTGTSIVNLGSLTANTIVDSTSFVVNSSNTLDGSTFNWLIIDPA